jgi:hypothetical protein
LKSRCRRGAWLYWALSGQAQAVIESFTYQGSVYDNYFLPNQAAATAALGNQITGQVTLDYTPSAVSQTLTLGLGIDAVTLTSGPNTFSTPLLNSVSFVYAVGERKDLGAGTISK